MRYKILLFLIIIMFAAVFRTTNLALVEFKNDEAINLFLASRPLFGHPFPPGGVVSSVGILNPPLLNYLLFPFTLITLDPKMISFFIGLLNSLAVGLLFLLIKRYYDLSTALIASSLLAFSPWAILFSRKIWAQDFILPLLIPLLYYLHKILIEKKMVYWVPYVITSLFLLQLHQPTLIFLLLLNGFLLLRKVKFNRRYIAIGFFIGIMPLVPYLIYILKNITADPQAFMLIKDKFSHQFFPLIFFRPFQIMSQGNFHHILGEDMIVFANEFPFVYHLRRLFYIEYLLLPFGTFIFWKKFPQFRFFVYVALGLPTIYFFLHFETFIHYFIVLIPFLFIFLASGLVFLLQHTNRFLKALSLLIFLALIITSITFNLTFFRLLNKQKAFKGDYGISFITAEQNVKKPLEKYKNDKAYQEMVLAGYLPKNIIYENLPVARMIFSYDETKSRLPALEERLKQVPEDPRVQNELIVFYTSSLPTEETMKFLKEKSLNLPGYKPIYDEVSTFLFKQKQ